MMSEEISATTVEETAALEARNVVLELEVQRLKGENRSIMFEVRVLRTAVEATCAYREYFGRPCVVREGRFTVPTTDEKDED